MKCLNKVTMIGAKILEILHWFTTAIMLVIAAGCLFMRERLADFLTAGVVSQGTELTSYGFEITAVQADGTLDMTAVLFFAVTAVICLSLMAMVYRNVYLIVRTAAGTTSFAREATPFQKDTIRMVREIGIFLISQSAVCLVMSIIARLFIGVEVAELSVNLDSLLMGVVALSLSQIFAYGTQLQEDVDGLL
ncbi:MAG: hypothetical protein ACLU9Q_07975 [Marvinbryantia sp.]|uniref:hypothetical protein n=1 Tax=Marvinbryantia sp. TaxID=2496532 RepID=UPI0025FA03CD|nr:hypothetical protein [uncultured Marvinbryantia sp.]